MGHQPLEVDRAHLRAVLLGLGFALGDLVVVDAPLDLLSAAVEEVDDAPEQALRLVREAGFGEQACERLEDGVDRALGGLGRGQGARIGLVLEGAVAVELQLVEEMARRALRRAVRQLVDGFGEMGVHDGPRFAREPRPPPRP